MDKQNVVYMYNGVSALERRAVPIRATGTMNLENIMPSETHQLQKDSSTIHGK